MNGGGQRLILLAQRPVCHSENTQPLSGVPIVRLHNALPVLRCNWPRGRPVKAACAQLHNFFRRALYKGQPAASLEGDTGLVDGCHPLTDRVKRQFHNTRVKLVHLRHINSRFCCRHAKAGLCRIAQNGVAFLPLLRGKKFCVGAQRRAAQQQLQRPAFPGRYHGVAVPDLPLGGIAFSADCHLRAGCPKVVDRHLILRQCSGFIGTDDIGTAKRLHR